MSKTLKMIVKELPKTMGQLNHELLLEDLKIALKEVVALEQQLSAAHRAAEESAKDTHRRGWEQCKKEVYEYMKHEERAAALHQQMAYIKYVADKIAAFEYRGGLEDEI